MPVAHFYVTACTRTQERRLLQEGSRRYAAALEAPLERVRIFLHRLPATSVAVSGQVVADSGTHAPYVTALLLRGRPIEQRHRLIAELTDLVVDVLGADRSLVRCLVEEVDPDGWGIGGRPASQVRSGEIAGRAGPE